jgi:CubicO group peptidase (beta-lactamase class C family)
MPEARWSRRRTLRVLAGLPLLRMLPGHADMAAAPLATGGPRERRAELLRALDEQCRAANVPAWGVAIVDAAGDVLAEARGRLPGLDADTPFRIGSITKTFTALALQRLAARQQLDIDGTPLRTLVPDAPFGNPWEAETPLTLAMLLEHTAGFGELTRREWDYADPRPISLREGLALDPASRTCLWRPGVQHVYSNASPGLVAWAIERRQPLDFTGYVRAEVVQPLGLRHTGFLREDASARRLVPGFRADGTTPIPYWHQHILAYGAMHASPADMARFMRTLLEDAASDDAARTTPRLLQLASARRMGQPRSGLAARAGLALGHGLGIYGSARHGFVFDGHGGDGDGYLSRFGLLRAARRGYFLVIASDNPPLFARLRTLVERWLTRDLARPPAQPGPAAGSPATDLARYVGHYRRAAARFRRPGAGAETDALEVTLEGPGLRLRGAVTADLLPTGAPGQFRPSAESVATSIFAAEGGELYLLGEPGNFLRTPPSAIAR